MLKDVVYGFIFFIVHDDVLNGDDTTTEASRAPMFFTVIIFPVPLFTDPLYGDERDISLGNTPAAIKSS